MAVDLKQHGQVSRRCVPSFSPFSNLHTKEQTGGMWHFVWCKIPPEGSSYP